jgi:hypothetical protein
VQLKDETILLTQDQMAMLFGKTKSTINEHIKNIYAEEELEESLPVVKGGHGPNPGRFSDGQGHCAVIRTLMP